MLHARKNGWLGLVFRSPLLLVGSTVCPLPVNSRFCGTRVTPAFTVHPLPSARAPFPTILSLKLIAHQFAQMGMSLWYLSSNYIFISSISPKIHFCISLLKKKACKHLCPVFIKKASSPLMGWRVHGQRGHFLPHKLTRCVRHWENTMIIVTITQLSLGNLSQ